MAKQKRARSFWDEFDAQGEPAAAPAPAAPSPAQDRTAPPPADDDASFWDEFDRDDPPAPAAPTRAGAMTSAVDTLVGEISKRRDQLVAETAVPRVPALPDLPDPNRGAPSWTPPAYAGEGKTDTATALYQQGQAARREEQERLGRTPPQMTDVAAVGAAKGLDWGRVFARAWQETLKDQKVKKVWTSMSEDERQQVLDRAGQAHGKLKLESGTAIPTPEGFAPFRDYLPDPTADEDNLAVAIGKGLTKGILSFGSGMANVAGELPVVGDAARSAARSIDTAAEAVTPNLPPGTAESFAAWVAESVGANLPGVGAGGTVRALGGTTSAASAAALGVLGLQTAGQKAGELAQRRPDMGTVERITRAAVHGATEVVPEWAFGDFERLFSPTKSMFWERFIRNPLMEVPSELLTLGLQTGLYEGRLPTVGEAATTGLAAIGQSVVMGGAGEVIQAVREGRMTPEQLMAERLTTAGIPAQAAAAIAQRMQTEGTLGEMATAAAKAAEAAGDLKAIPAAMAQGIDTFIAHRFPGLAPEGVQALRDSVLEAAAVANAVTPAQVNLEAVAQAADARLAEQTAVAGEQAAVDQANQDALADLEGGDETVTETQPAPAGPVADDNLDLGDETSPVEGPQQPTDEADDTDEIGLDPEDAADIARAITEFEGEVAAGEEEAKSPKPEAGPTETSAPAAPAPCFSV